MRLKHFGLQLAAVLSLHFAANAGLAQRSTGTPAVDVATELASFDTAWIRIRETYYDPAMRGLDWNSVRDELRPTVAAGASRAATRAAISAMLSRLGESHFVLLPAEAPQGDESSKNRDGSGDVGAELRLVEGLLLVSRVDTASPAHAAGIRPGWILQRVDSVSADSAAQRLLKVEGERERGVAALRLTMSFIQRLAGSPGSVVRLTLRDSSGKSVERALTRRQAPGQLVQFGALPPVIAHLEWSRSAKAAGCVGVIRFNVWMAAIAAPFDDAMSELRQCDGLILDLRGNIGGVAAMVMGMAGYFFKEEVSLGVLKLRGAELRYVTNPRTVTRHGQPTTTYSGPLALIVDELTASTSEVFAGALQHLGRARVFGSRSAGQALPSLAMRLPNGDGLMYAVADFTAPGGRRLEGAGVHPDLVVRQDRETLLTGVDHALKAAVDWITNEARSSRSFQ